MRIAEELALSLFDVGKGFFKQDHVRADDLGVGIMHAGLINDAFVAFKYSADGAANMMHSACQIKGGGLAPAAGAGGGIRLNASPSFTQAS